MKRCVKCGEEKLIGEFYLTTQRGKPYRRPQCKTCECARHKKRRMDNPSLKATQAEQARTWRKNNQEQYRSTRLRRQEKDRFRKALSKSIEYAAHSIKLGYKSCTATEEELKAAFSGYCFICGVPEMECNERLSMDHDHETGKFRGWLCASCNKAAGFLKDSPDLMRKLAEYIEQSKMEGSCVNDLTEDRFEFLS